MTGDGRQLSLFGAGEEPALSERSTVAVRHDDSIKALGARLRERCPNVRLGTSSWTFPGWSGLVYAPTRRGGVGEAMLRRDGLKAYARHPLFRTVGVDRSFYAPPTVDDWARYARQVPDDFRFLVKADRALTSVTGRNGRPNPLWLDTAHAIEQVLAPTVEGLGPKLGVVVAQFPPLRLGLIDGVRGFLDGLTPFLRSLNEWRRDHAPSVTVAIEIRNVEPYGPQHVGRLRDLLAETHAILVHCHHPAAPPMAAQLELFPAASQPQTVVRWMLRRNHQYEEAADHYRPFDRLQEPDEETRRAIAQLVRDAQTLNRTAWVIANNKAEGCSPETIRALAEELAR